MKVSKEALDVQAQVGVSIGLARSVVASWLPPVEKDKSGADGRAQAKQVSADRGPVMHTRPRAGLGYGDEASTQTHQPRDEANGLDDLKLRRQLMYKNKKVEERRKAEQTLATKRIMREDDSSDDDAAKGKASKRKDKAARASGTKHGLAAFDLYKSNKKAKR